MTKAENYLYERLSMLSDEKVIIITKINNLEIEIEEINDKIKEISNDVDDTFEIFSPRVKKNDFIRDEIDKLKKSKDELHKQLENLNKQYSLIDDDISLIKDAVGETTLTNEEFNKLKDDIENVHKESTVGLHILEMQESERQRIARELNDSTLQVLANLVHKCEICSKVMDVDSVRTKLELEIMARTLKETINDMRNIIYNLSPFPLDDFELDVEITRIISKIKETTDVNVEFKIIGNVYKIKSIIAMTLLRIIEETSANSINYSNCKNVEIKLEYRENEIHLEISDDGDGYILDEILKPEENENDGFSVAMIKERVLLLSGEIEIESKIKEGTRILIDIPSISD